MPVIFTTLEHTHAMRSWLDTLLEGARRFSLSDGEPSIALPVKRLNRDGVFVDNPPIDAVDDLLILLEQRSVRLAMISVPVSNVLHRERWSEELSHLNGWIDTAGYTGCSWVRLDAGERSIPDYSIPSEGVNEFPFTLYQEVAAYAIETGVTLCFSGFRSGHLDAVIQPFSQEQRGVLGMERPCSSLSDIIQDREQHDFITLYSFPPSAAASISLRAAGLMDREETILIEC